MKRDVEEFLKETLALPSEARTALVQALPARVESEGNEDADARRLFERARHRALKRLREGLDLQWVPASSREELHRL